MEFASICYTYLNNHSFMDNYLELQILAKDSVSQPKEEEWS